MGASVLHLFEQRRKYVFFSAPHFLLKKSGLVPPLYYLSITSPLPARQGNGQHLDGMSGLTTGTTPDLFPTGNT